MYASYQLQGLAFETPDQYLDRGRKLESENSQLARKHLDSFISPDGVISASTMMEEWFPISTAQVFISHSRADKDLALTLAGWLKDTFEIVSFVDSCMWGHSNKLLRQLDNAHSKTGPSTYSYERSTIMAGHVHLMLSTALTQMMDQCECIFFLNTGHSSKTVSVNEMAESSEEHVTQSPWLFHEISMMQLLRRRKKEDHRPQQTSFSIKKEAALEELKFNYIVSLDDLPVLKGNDFNAWGNKSMLPKNKNIGSPLDLLYEIRPPHLQDTLMG